MKEGARVAERKRSVIELQVMAANWALQRCVCVCVYLVRECVRLQGCRVDEAVRVKCGAPAHSLSVVL